MVGNDLLVVFSVLDLPKPLSQSDLMFRIDPEGEVFAAISLPSSTK